MCRASGGSNGPRWIRNNILDFQRAMPVKIAVENGKICNKTMMGERLKRISEVWIVDETYCFRLDFVEKMERRFRSTSLDMGAVLERKMNLGFVYIWDLYIEGAK